MVILSVKHNDENQFLFLTTLESPIEETVVKITEIYNGRLKINRICSEMEELAKHGTLYPPEILGLTDDQVVELKLEDSWGDKCVPSCYTITPDPIGRRNGKQPAQKYQDIIAQAIKDAKALISKNLVLEHKPLTKKIIQEAISILKGATLIVYPMNLPPHDIIRQEFENIEDLSGTQASLEVIDPAIAQLWFCGKEMYHDRCLGEYIGKIENSKVIVKLSKKGQGPPAREPVMTEQERKEFMMQAYRRQEELKKLEADDDDHYFNSAWADSSNMKKAFHGLNNISWRPGRQT